MNNQKLFVENRRQRRFNVYGGTFAVLQSHPHSSKPCSILDISNGGMSFYYFENSYENIDDFFELDLFISGEGLFLAKLPFEIVSEIVASKAARFSSITRKRFGVKFIHFDQPQTAQLKNFIHNHTQCDLLPDNSA